MLAGKNGHAEVVRALMETGRLDAHSTDKVTALHEAVTGRHAATVHALTTFCVDVNTVTQVRFVGRVSTMGRHPTHLIC